MSEERCADRRRLCAGSLSRTSRSRLLIALSLALVSSCANNSASPSTNATNKTTTTPAVDRDPVSTAGSTARGSAGAKAALARLSAVTAVGDSVPYGTACNCTPYPQLIASAIARRTGHAVDTFNDAVPGYRSTDVLRQLQSNPTTIAHVENADAVLIEVGANDIAFSGTCGTDVPCYETKLPQVTKNISAIVSRIRHLTAGRNVAVVVLDYWSVWLGGKYAQARGPAYVDAASSLTRAFGNAIQSIASTTDSTYVDLRTAFRGPNDDRDETNLLAGDGDHPNAAGHERIADAILQTVATA